MDVRCNRCGTEYEFDDALISERGTTVKCTNCSYQFKIYPRGAAGSVPERWVVRGSDGRENVYTSLRDLQRAIADRRVGPHDLLSRGADPPRALGSIPELEPFFATQVPNPRQMQSPPHTLHGIAPTGPGAATTLPQPIGKVTRRGIGIGKTDAGGAVANAPNAPVTERLAPSTERTAPPTGASASAPQTTLDRTLPIERPSQDAGPGRTLPLSHHAPVPTQHSPVPNPAQTAPLAPAAPRTERGAPPPPAQGSAPTPPPQAAPPQAAVPQKNPDFLATVPSPVAPTAPPPVAEAATQLSAAAPNPLALQATEFARGSTPRAAENAPLSRAQLTPRPPQSSDPRLAPDSRRDKFPSYDTLGEAVPEPGRRARSRWIAGVVALAVAGLFGATIGRQYLSKYMAPPAKIEKATDDRVKRLLDEGMRALDSADYEAAKEAFVKAQALADRDAKVLSALARLETLRADLFWLKLRLLDPSAGALVQSTHRELGQRVGRARTAVDRAFAVAPEDPAVAAARVDILRIAGEEKRAREWIAPVSQNGSDPGNAYVLAALDLAEASPVWGTVIERLKSASVSTHEVVRARAALIYALVRAGRGNEAEGELAKIRGAEPPHPLLDELEAFVKRLGSTADAGTDAAAATATALDPTQLPSLETQPGAEPAAAAGEPLTGDFRVRLTRASTALASGDLTRAEALYESVLKEQPQNTEALSGLADVARRKNDSGKASELYDRVLEQNPSYLPALMASADQKFQSGDKKGAVALYRRILEQAGAGTEYGERAAARIAQAESSGGDQPAQPAPAETAPKAEELK
jgi:predicted Zn finger-like uncharacterized protein